MAACGIAGLMVTASCASTPGTHTPARSLSESDLSASLLGADDIDAVMATTHMAAHEPVTHMSDDRNLLPNLDCLGVWQVDEAAVYDPSGWQSVRQQMFRDPDRDSWNSIAVQSVVLYRNAEEARRFVVQSADRWARCTDHRVNIRLNDKPLPSWRSGNLARTDTELTMPYLRGSGTPMWSCEHALAVADNAVLDVAACKPHQTADLTAAGDIVHRLEANLPAR